MTKPRIQSLWRTWRWPVVVVALAAAAWGAKVAFFTDPPAPEVITVAVERGEIEDTVLAAGTIEAEKEVSVGAQVSGQIQRLHVALGDQVRQGQLIAEIDSTTQANTLRNAEAQVALLQAQLQARRASLKQAQAVLARQQALFKADATAKAELDAAEAALAASEADVAVLQAQIRQATISMDTARVNLGYTRILAPMDGVVTAVLVEEGRTVNAAQSAPTIIKLSKLDRVLIKAQISEADVVRVKPDMPVYFTILGDPLKRYEARLRTIEPSTEADQTSTTTTTTSSSSSTNAVYYNGLFEVPNPEGQLRISMTAQVSIVLAKADQALLVPSSALGKLDRKTGRHEVRVLQGDPDQPEQQTIVSRQVKVGLNNRVQAQVLEGLQEGDLVVVGDATMNSGSVGMRRSPGMF